ncbi:hypothetical protein OCH239_18735 [Roseivivax halodurans JCM 10272]|uniref:HTH luxR-type domain-containing protein n=2 Tax=Roseivivax halodurans TaxID=93683 RepID=X7E7F9_9RHOB|nr:hypothetical protein OCH239_18735 [Roseivivax halodurans JCM 10272]
MLSFAANSALFIALARHRNDTEQSWKIELAQLVLYEAFRRQKSTGSNPSPQDLILNQIDQGIILIDELRNVIYQNDAAVSVLARSTNIAIQTGELVGRYQTVTQKLEATILTVTTEDEIRTVALPIGILGHPEVITFVPLLDQPGCVLVCFGRSTDVDPEITKSVLSAFGLTPAECRLALALQRGASVNEIAVQANLKVTTARGYLKRIFLKIGARRQPELVAFIAAITPGLRIARDRLKERRDR